MDVKIDFESKEARQARALRLAITRNLIGQNLLERDEAVDFLKGCLTPGDETTQVDDSELIDISVADFIKRFFYDTPSVAGLSPEDLVNRYFLDKGEK